MSTTWPDRRILDLFGIEIPIVQAPMAGSQLSSMAIPVCNAGGLGSLPCAMLTPEQIWQEIDVIRRHTSQPFNLNFFCHHQPKVDKTKQAAWLGTLAPYYSELGLTPDPNVSASRYPFDEKACRLVEELEPPIVSFHFGLPEPDLLERVKRTGAKVISSATTVEEAVWLAEAGCDAIIAQGAEAGGHRGMFLTKDVFSQVGTMALVPQIVDSVSVPVIAAGGIGDGRGIAAALALGASAVQLGTAFLFCPEATLSEAHFAALRRVSDDGTAITNVFTGRPARGIVNRLMREVGLLSDLAPEFPLASAAVAPLRAESEARGSGEFVQMWSGQAAQLGRELRAGPLTQLLADEALQVMSRLR